MKKNLSWRRICSILLSLAVLLYLFYQIYSVSHDTIQTEYALDYTYHETIPLNAFVVRQETLLTTNATGVIGYAQANGSKVPAEQVIARVFETDEQAAVQAQLDEVNELIDDLSSLQKEGTQLSVNAEILDSRINQSINRYLSITDRRSMQGSDTAMKELLRLLNKKQLTLGSGGNIAQYLASLQQQKSSLEAGVTNCVTVTTPEAGYFVNQVDGCENTIDYQKVKELTAVEINNALEQEVTSSSGVGKVVTNNEWYLTAVINQSLAQQIQLDSIVTVTIPVLSDEEYSCTVEALNIDYSADTVALVLKCSQINPDILGVRKVQAQLRTNTYNGLRIRSDALRVIDGITGVYVVDGISAMFKPVELLYSDSGLAICKYDTTKANHLKIYDEVIVEGSGIHDGKVIR
ncbi:MAG: hypothetical protein IKM39_04000 [Clostridia bacterium]|nr:hypothetical protein [Clostridia bacterium]